MGTPIASTVIFLIKFRSPSAVRISCNAANLLVLVLCEIPLHEFSSFCALRQTRLNHRNREKFRTCKYRDARIARANDLIVDQLIPFILNNCVSHPGYPSSTTKLVLPPLPSSSAVRVDSMPENSRLYRRCRKRYVAHDFYPLR